MDSISLLLRSSSALSKVIANMFYNIGKWPKSCHLIHICDTQMW